MTAASRPTRRWHRRLAVLTIGGLLVAACGGGDDDTAEPDDATTTEDDGGEPATEDDGGEPATDDDGSEPATDDGDDDDTSDGSPVVETLPPEENADPVVGGTLRYGISADTNGINPAASSMSVNGLMMGNAVFDTLSATTPDGQWVPYLAESFTPNDDFTQWTMKLREGISFHDGTPLNADAVVTNFESQRAHPLVGLAVKPFYPEEGATTVVDDLTVTFNLLDPDAKWPTAVAGQLGMVASPTWLAAAAEDGTLNQEPVGTGPFKFESRSEDSVTRFVRNDDWWNGEVYLDAVEFFPVPDPDARNDLLFGGDLDALHTTNQASILDLQDDGSIQNVLNDASEESFAMINSSQAPFDDVRARKALTLATPVDLYNDLIALGVNRPAEQMFIPESPFYNPDVVQEHDDPEAAAALVAEYCAERGTETNELLGTPTCTDGKINMEFQYSGPAVVQTRIAELLEEAWSGAGFNVTFNELFEDEHISQTAFGQYNVNTWRQFGAANPTNDNIWLLCRTIGGISLNWPRFCDEERDALIFDAMALPDDADRVPLMQELVKQINEDYLYIFFNHTLWDNAFAEYVHGICDRVAPDGTPLECSSNGRTWFSSVWID